MIIVLPPHYKPPEVKKQGKGSLHLSPLAIESSFFPRLTPRNRGKESPLNTLLQPPMAVGLAPVSSWAGLAIVTPSSGPMALFLPS